MEDGAPWPIVRRPSAVERPGFSSPPPQPFRPKVLLKLRLHRPPGGRDGPHPRARSCQRREEEPVGAVRGGWARIVLDATRAVAAPCALTSGEPAPPSTPPCALRDHSPSAWRSARPGPRHGGAIHSQNWDWRDECRESVVILKVLGRAVETDTLAEDFDRPRHGYTRALLSVVPELEPAGPGYRVRRRGEALRRAEGARGRRTRPGMAGPSSGPSPLGAARPGHSALRSHPRPR